MKLAKRNFEVKTITHSKGGIGMVGGDMLHESGVGEAHPVAERTCECLRLL